MPHLTLEYSANLADETDMRRLCAELAQCLDGQRDGERKVFPTGGIRVRALRSDAYFIADGSIIDAAFVHANLKLGKGRSPAVIEAARTALFDVIKRHFAAAYKTRGFAASLEISEFGPAGTLKYNNLHDRLAVRAGD